MAFLWFGKRKISIDLSGKKGTSPLRWAVRTLLVPLILLLFVVMALASYYFYSKYHALVQVSGKVPPSSTDPVQSVITQVDKHLLLPGGEQPVLAKVSDLEPLAAYPFFRNALVGDEVLVYCKHGLSILYSPGRDKVIEVTNQALSGACDRAQ